MDSSGQSRTSGVGGEVAGRVVADEMADFCGTLAITHDAPSAEWFQEHLAAAEARGRAADQADVVAWLRSAYRVAYPTPDEARMLQTVRTVSVHIERGEHVGAAAPERRDLDGGG